MASLEGGQQLWLQKIVWFYKSLRENGPTAHLIYDPSKNFLMGLRSQSLVSSLIEYNIIYFCLLRHLFDIYLKVGRKWGNDEQQMARTNQGGYREDLNHQYMLTLPVQRRIHKYVLGQGYRQFWWVFLED